MLFLLPAFSTAQVDRQFEVQRKSDNVRFLGLSNAGVAIAENVSSVSLNPALAHAFHSISERKTTIFSTFIKGGYFDDYIVSSGVSHYLNPKTSVAVVYKNLRRDKYTYSNSATLNIAGQLFNETDQGAVVVGVNMRYENDVFRSVNGLVSVTSRVYDSTGAEIVDTVIGTYSANIPFTKHTDHRFLVDLGFFQDNVLKNLNFGIVFYNLGGYSWKRTDTELRDSLIFTSDTSASLDTVTDSTYYVSATGVDNSRNKKNYKRMSFGISYLLPLGKKTLSFMVPLDLEFLGIFNKKQKTIMNLHTGFEFWFAKNAAALRIGYSRAPEHITGSIEDLTVSKINIFTAGGSLRLKRIGLDLFFVPNSGDWGANIVTVF